MGRPPHVKGERPCRTRVRPPPCSAPGRTRTAEVGVRIAFGASPGSILRLFVGQGLRLSAAGIGVGLLGALALTRVIGTLLVGVAPTDPFTFVAMAALFIAVAAFASWLPARRAQRLDPTVALRRD